MSTARYDSVAETYGVGLDPLAVSATRMLLDLTKSIQGMRVLDVACGHGLVTRELARRDATRIVGIDLSTGLLQRAIAEEQGEPLGIEYLEADASSPETLTGQEFDLAVSNFGLSDIDDLAGLGSLLNRVLTDGGRFVFSILHPCFPGSPGVSGAWPTDRTYYSESFWRATGKESKLRQAVGSNHRMVSTYLNTLYRSGFFLQGLHEPEPDAELLERSPEMGAYPLYLVADLVKPAN